MGCCNVFSILRLLTVFLVLLVFCAGLILPWYQVHAEIKTDHYHGTCTIFYQAFYNYTTCHCNVFHRDCDDWINARANTGFHWWDEWSTVQYQRIVYLTLWGAVGVCAFWILLQLWTSHPGISIFVLVLSLATAVSFFTLPLAYRSDFENCRDGPCNQLIGSGSGLYGSSKYHWNPWYGWTAPIVAIPFLLVLALFACCERRTQAKKYSDVESSIVYVTAPWSAASSQRISTPLAATASPSYSAVPLN